MKQELNVSTKQYSEFYFKFSGNENFSPYISYLVKVKADFSVSHFSDHMDFSDYSDQ